MIQGTDEWRQARLGKVTASRVADVIAKTKTTWASSRANYMSELIVERLTGQPAETYTNAAMAWGSEQEPNARAAYAWRTDSHVDEVGFIDHPTISMAGASPDGMIGALRLIEIKCPSTATHLETLLTGAGVTKYMPQMQWQMACAHTHECDFVSYDPRLPEPLQLYIKRVFLDNDMTDSLEKQVRTFLKELDAKLCALRSTYELTEVLKESANG